MNSSGSSNIQGTAKTCLLVKAHLSISMNMKTGRQKADPEGISEDKTLVRQRCCNHMADPTIAVELPQRTARLGLPPPGLSLPPCLAQHPSELESFVGL